MRATAHSVRIASSGMAGKERLTGLTTHDCGSSSADAALRSGREDERRRQKWTRRLSQGLDEGQAKAELDRDR